MYKTTAKDFNIYKKACIEYIEKLSLGCWEPRFIHTKDPLGFEGCRAAICASRMDKTVTLHLNTYWDAKPTPKLLKASARHEILHLLTWDLLALASDPKIEDDILCSEEHALIKRLERVIK